MNEIVSNKVRGYCEKGKGKNLHLLVFVDGLLIFINQRAINIMIFKL